MRGPQTLQGGIFSYVSLESRIPEDHPLRAIRRLVDAALEQLSRRFDGIYAKGVGRPSVPPEQLLRALLLQVLYTIRSERQLIEQIDYNLLYRWFVGLELDDEVFSATVFTKNRERLLKGEIAQHFFEGGAGAGGVGGVGVIGALHGGRDADRGVGEPEELRAQGREAQGR